MLAERALQAAYPVVAQLLGEESFADLARALWHAYPPVRGDIACWGEHLPAFMRSSAQLAEEPFLPDVADVEWALHQCSSAPDGQAQLTTLALLTTNDPATLHFLLAPGCTVVCSAWPVASVLGAHVAGEPSIEEAGAHVRAGLAQEVVVWRQGLRPQVRLGQVGEADFVMALLRGETLAQALDAVPTFDFAQWLPMAVQTGLLLAVVRKVAEPGAPAG